MRPLLAALVVVVVLAAAATAFQFKQKSPHRSITSQYYSELDNDEIPLPPAPPVAPNSPEKSLFFSKKDFETVGLSEKMIAVLASLSILRPSKIQSLSFTDVYAKKNTIISDQTGSGKTLSYLIPSLQRMTEEFNKKSKKSEKETKVLKSRSPYMVIITPTTELAIQVSKVVKSLANALKFRTSCITSVSDQDSEQKKLRLGVEVRASLIHSLYSVPNTNHTNFFYVFYSSQIYLFLAFLSQIVPISPIQGVGCDTRPSTRPYYEE
jgi:hypothetical protein